MLFCCFLAVKLHVLQYFLFYLFIMFDFQGLPSNIHSEGPLIDDLDWSFADGRPGVPRLDLFLNNRDTYSLYIEIKHFPTP